jgi:hypothetical protein
MKRVSLLLCLAVALASSASSGAGAQPPPATQRTAFYYGSALPNDLLSAYDQVVVEPDHVAGLKAFEGRRARPIAYLSIGEVARASARAKGIDRSWVLAENAAWSSLVMDVANPNYRAYVIDRFEQLWAAGYRGFFLDTLDSYRLARRPEREPASRRGLVAIIEEVGRRHPGVQLLVNRGFELLSDVSDVISGVVAESLFDRWDAATQSYGPVPEADRRWLVAELERARDQLGLHVTVIDYRPEDERPQARETARKILALGFEPWVTNAALDAVGVGSLEILPRRVLILTDEIAGGEPDAVRFLAPVLEYLGYVPEHRRVPTRWSELPLEQGYQGLITWFTGQALPPGYDEWLSAARRRGLRVVVFGAPGFDVAGRVGRELGLVSVAPASTRAARVRARDALVGFEAEPPPRPFDGPLVRLRPEPGTAVHLELADERGRAGVAVASTAWGGLALSHVFALRGLSGQRAWVIDPFAFLRRALSLPDAPMPNVTSESGRRIGMILVRPEGLAAPAAHGHASAALALGQWLAAHHAWPHSLARRASDPQATVSAADRAAAECLLELGFFEQAELAPGTTTARGRDASLTEVGGLFRARELTGPIALDSLYLTSGSPRAYPYRDVLRTFEFTETPRRLAPVLVDFHGYLVSSPGGRGTLSEIYDALERAELHPLFVSEWAELARAFGEVVVARGLDGSFHYFGGDRLRTFRSPLALGWPLSLGAQGAAIAREGPDGIYSTFAARTIRHLAFGGTRLARPHLAQANGRLLSFDVRQPQPFGEHGAEVELATFELGGHVPLELELAGLPAGSACVLTFSRGRAQGTTDERGSLHLSLGVSATGAARLTCRVTTNDG